MTDKQDLDVDRLHGEIMNIRCDKVPSYPFSSVGREQVRAYKDGHLDARHAAAEIALNLAAPPAQPAEQAGEIITPGTWRHLKLMMEHSAWDDVLQLADALANIDEFARVYNPAQPAPAQEPQQLWLWKNFVDGKPEYWAFDNAFPVYMDSDDPQTLGEPCGYAIFKPSRQGRADVSDAEVLCRIAATKDKP